uniref:helix-turn-helix domain-containing protein n=1 Tax=Pseudonocardia sp. CA-138482 TaxID=3240023 RepID=UPI003F496A41
MTGQRIDPTDYAEVRQGRRFPYATVGDYVALSDVSDRAARVYWLLRMHVNGGRGDEKAWPAQRTLADILKLKKTDSIGAAIRELIELGAVSVDVVATPKGRANIYTVHEAPPDDYAGPKRLSDFYKQRDETAGQPASPPGEGSSPNRRRIGGQNRSSAGVTPQTGVTPGRREGDPSERGEGSPPGEGSELPVVEPAEENQGGDVSGERHLHERPPARDAPPPPKADWQNPDTWLCAEHLALLADDPGADRPACGRCARVVAWAKRKRAEQAGTEQAEAEAAKARERAERLAEVEQQRAQLEAARAAARAALGGSGHAEFLKAREAMAARCRSSPTTPPRTRRSAVRYARQPVKTS